MERHLPGFDAPGDYQAITQRLSGRRWTRRWRRNSAKCARSWHIAGTLYSNDGTCAAALAAHYCKRMTFWAAPAQPRSRSSRSTAARSAVVIECANAMGDAMRWKR